MDQEGKVEFDDVMASAHSIVLEMNATIKDFATYNRLRVLCGRHHIQSPKVTDKS